MTHHSHDASHLRGAGTEAAVRVRRRIAEGERAEPGVRGGKLNAHVFMRSSDVWLGVPYDVFNFSMLSHLVCGLLNKHRPAADAVSPGRLFLTAASSHLYETNWEDARRCLASQVLDQVETPELLWNDPTYLMSELKTIRDSRPGDACRWWEL